MYQYYEGVMYNLPTDVTKIVEYLSGFPYSRTLLHTDIKRSIGDERWT